MKALDIGKGWTQCKSLAIIPWHMELIPQVGNTFSNGFFVTVRASASQQGEASTYPDNIHTYNKDILIPHIK